MTTQTLPLPGDPPAPATDADPARRPALVLTAAIDGWADWLLGDGTAYRVRIIPIEGGPDHADRLLLVNCCGRTLAVQYADPRIAPYRAERWTRTRWRREGRHHATGGHDWWTDVVRPLLAAAGVA